MVTDPTPLFELEQLAGNADWMVGGLDEVGRGSIAGPVTLGFTVAPPEYQREGHVYPPVRDSKLLSAKRRDALVEPIKEWAAAWGVGHASNSEIDEYGISAALCVAGWRAVMPALAQLSALPQRLIIIADGPNNLLKITPKTPVELLPPAEILRELRKIVTIVPKVKGDMLCVTVAAASVLAKTERDVLMGEHHTQYPYYGWDRNKGYGGAAAHIEGLASHGVSPVHRVSWKLPGVTKTV